MLFSFDDLSLDRDRRELRRGADAIAVEPQVFDLLVYLIENRDRVVSRDDLIEAVWDGRIVSESTLASRISAARLAVGDSGKVQRLIKTIPRKGFCFVGDISEEAKRRTPQSNAAVIPIPAQSISFCRTSDGVSIALATAGAGPVLMKTGHWLSHLEYDWQSPIWSPMYARLAARFRFVRYDGRGNGLSDRDVPDISFAGIERDLDAAVAALGLNRFVLLGLSQGAAAAISYAARHPQRVSGLIIYGGYAQGRNRRDSPDELARAQMVLALMRHGWGQEELRVHACVQLALFAQRLARADQMVCRPAATDHYRRACRQTAHRLRRYRHRRYFAGRQGAHIGSSRAQGLRRSG